jgi:hypothetical protein
MRRCLRYTGVLAIVLLGAYVGSFFALVQVGKGYARARDLSNAYFLADPDADPGYKRHYTRGRFYAPLVYFTQHWIGGPYPVYP